MKTTIALLSVMALAGSLSFAKDAPGRGPKGPPRDPGREQPNLEQMFKKLDTNRDRQISLEEFKASPFGQRLGDKAEEVFNRIDKDSSGGISFQEFKAHRPGDHPPEDRPNIEEIFKKFDTDGDGQISLEEFKASPIGKRLGDKAEEHFNQLDKDSSGGISLDEFKAHRPPPHGDRPNPEEVFKKLDTDGDGLLTLDELKAGPMGQRLGDKIEELFKKLDTDSSGGISLEEFKAFRPERRGPERPGEPDGGEGPPPAEVE